MVDQSAGGWCCTPQAGILTPDWDFGELRHGHQREGGTIHTGSHMIPCTPYRTLRDTCRLWPHQSHSAGDAGRAAVQNLSPPTEVLLLEWAADLQRRKTQDVRKLRLQGAHADCLDYLWCGRYWWVCFCHFPSVRLCRLHKSVLV